MQQARRDYGQEFWWKPGEPTPERAPDIGTALRERGDAQGLVKVNSSESKFSILPHLSLIL
jgi:hypothetical protein